MNSEMLHLPALHSVQGNAPAVCVGLHRHTGPTLGLPLQPCAAERGRCLGLSLNLAHCMSKSQLQHLEGVPQSPLNLYPGSWTFPISSHWLPQVMVALAGFIFSEVTSIPQGDSSRLPPTLTSGISRPTDDFRLWQPPSC